MNAPTRMLSDAPLTSEHILPRMAGKGVFPTELRRLREAGCMTRAELSRQAHVPYSHLGAWERGVFLPTRTMCAEVEALDRLVAAGGKAAIAYVTRDLVGFRKADVLVVDASPHTIANGETDAPLLRNLLRKQVRVYHCSDLHAKVLLLGDVAVISSGNMSNSSADGLVEAAVLSDHASTVSGVASFIEQVVQQSEELDLKRIASLCRIKVIRRGGGPGQGGRRRRKTRLARLGNRTWLIGVRELVRDPAPDEQKMIAKALKTLRPRIGDGEPEWIRWSGKNRFVRECREGDSLIQIWRSSRAKRPSVVIRAAPVLLKQQTTRWTRFYVPPASGIHAEMSWGRFQRLLRSLGYPHRVGPCIEHLLESDMADAIQRQWTKWCRSKGSA